MLYLILKRIQISSESAVDFLKKKVTSLKISEVEGENVDTVVSLIKSAYYALLSASSPTRSFVPDEFPYQVLLVMQTSSNDEFNKVFATEVADARRLADKYGGQPTWSTVTQTLSQATSTYRRMLQSGTWEIPKKRAAAFVADTSTDERPRKRERRCFNCDGDHLLPQCPKPRDEARIEKAKQAFLAQKKTTFSRTSKPPYKMAKDGRKLTLNEKGYYVHDVSSKKKGDKAEKRAAQKAKKAEKAEAKATSLADKLATTVSSMVAKLHVTPSPSASTTSSANVAANSDISGDLASYRSELREVLLAQLRDV